MLLAPSFSLQVATAALPAAVLADILAGGSGRVAGAGAAAAGEGGEGGATAS